MIYNSCMKVWSQQTKRLKKAFSLSRSSFVEFSDDRSFSHGKMRERIPFRHNMKSVRRWELAVSLRRTLQTAASPIRRTPSRKFCFHHFISQINIKVSAGVCSTAGAKSETFIITNAGELRKKLFSPSLSLSLQLARLCNETEKVFLTCAD